VSAAEPTAEESPVRRIRLLLADDHPVVRAGLAGMLAAEEDLDIVGEAADGDAAVVLARELLPDVVLMDLRMPGTDGATATARISRELPQVRVVVLTTYDTDGDIVRAVEAGASGYLLKDTPRRELADAVRAAARGETVLAPAAAAILLTRMRTPAPVQQPLTARETQVLALVGEGRTNADIGRELFISEATVKTHLIRIFQKLGVDDRTAAVTAAMRGGLLPPA